MKSQIISVPDTHGVPRQHPANDYQVRAVRPILTGNSYRPSPDSNFILYPLGNNVKPFEWKWNGKTSLLENKVTQFWFHKLKDCC